VRNRCELKSLCFSGHFELFLVRASEAIYSMTPAIRIRVKDINPTSTTWQRGTLYSCNGFSAIRYFPLLLKIGNGNVTLQDFIKQYFPVLFKIDDGISGWGYYISLKLR
jgi:hypothetical protein